MQRRNLYLQRSASSRRHRTESRRPKASFQRSRGEFWRPKANCRRPRRNPRDGSLRHRKNWSLSRSWLRNESPRPKPGFLLRRRRRKINLPQPKFVCRLPRKSPKTRSLRHRKKIFTTETAANDRVSAAREEIESLKNQLTDFEQKLSEATEAERVNVEKQQANVEGDDSTDGGGEMYASSVEDGSPSLIQCLNEELDRWKRHCHVLGDELKQQREQFAEELGEQDSDQQMIEEPTVNTVFEEPQYDEQSPDEAEDPPVAEPEHTVWSAPGTSVDGNGGDAADADELTDIRGIGKVIASKLHELGIYRYEQLASLDDDDFDRVHDLIPDFERRMRRDNWMEQARDLHSSKYSEQI